MMEFSRDPGPFPFVTIRERDKWKPRLAGMERIEVIGVHGCTLKHQWAKVVKIEPYEGAAPAGLPYAGKKLIAITLDRYPARTACCRPTAGTPPCWDCPHA